MSVQREWVEKDYYAVLGVSKEVSQKEITAAYRQLARKLHPDANPNNKAAEERFKEVSSAYDVVGDPERRKEYDKVRALGPLGATVGGGRGPGGGFGGTNMTGDIGDLLGDLFGRSGGGGPAGGPGGGPRGAQKRGSGMFSRGPQRGDDLETDLHLSFLDVFKGVTTSVNLVGDAVCNDCNGSGAAVGTTPRVCVECGGQGVLADDQGFFSFSRPCSVCGGRGTVVDNPCLSCSGSGVVTRPRVVKVRIPDGIRDGQQIRLKGKGGPGKQGGPPGDLYVRVCVDPHPWFAEEGDNITIQLPITYAEATLGADVRVPTIDGDTVTIRIPPGTPPGRTFRVRSRGFPTEAGRGDLLVTVEISIPTVLTPEERVAVEALKDAAGESPRAHMGS